MSTRRGLSLRVALAFILSHVGSGLGRPVLDHLANATPAPSFGQRYGSNPKSHNGGQRSGAAAAKRAARKRRNVSKHPRTAA